MTRLLNVEFDDGTVLGSAASTECQIDSISQSWAVLSGSGDTRRAHGMFWKSCWAVN